MAKRIHEIRDPIHNFIRLDSGERNVLDSRPFQRLRYIHQLALTYLVYPGATHRRFEHSLGVMELAGRVYDIVTEPDNIPHMIHTITSTGAVFFAWQRCVMIWDICRFPMRLRKICFPTAGIMNASQ